MAARRSRRQVLALLPLPLTLALSACSSSSAAVAASPTAAITGEVSVTVASAAPTPQATPTASPPATTATPSAPTDTPEPTATSAPNASPTPTPVSATALNALQPGRGWDFALRPLLFQIDNAPDARPQSGLSSAYVVYETLAEGGITRYTALIVQQALNQIGNVRSARLIDIDLVQQWNGVLLHVGASTPVAQLLAAAKIVQVDFDLGQNAAASYRTANRVAPYNLYTGLARLRPYLSQNHIDQQAALPRAYPVGPLPSGAGTAAPALTIPYGSPSDAGYVWDATANGFLRSTDGQRVIDADTGRTVVVNNVVVHFAQEVVTDIIEDTEGSHSLKFTLTGTGKAILLRDGRRLDLTWRRARPADLMAYAMPDGSAAPFAAGNIWVSFVPDTMQVG